MNKKNEMKLYSNPYEIIQLNQLKTIVQYSKMKTKSNPNSKQLLEDSYDLFKRLQINK